MKKELSGLGMEDEGLAIYNPETTNKIEPGSVHGILGH
jgi:hypothetical protein